MKPTYFIHHKKYEYNIGKRRRPKRKNLGKKEKSKGVYKLVVVDRISELPDEILVSILSLLPLKEAAATSMLSRRWRYVWMSTRTLNFDAQFELVRNYQHFIQLEPEVREQESHRYINWVNHVVEQHRGPTIEQFKACFHIDCRFTGSIDKWIQFALEKRVEILELKFFPSLGYKASNGSYTFPDQILGLGEGYGSKHLYSDIPRLHSCGYNNGLKSLRVLSFQWVDVTGEVLEYMFSHCAVLERLTVCGSRKLVNLKVVGPSIALKYLDIGYCYGLKSIEICDANLVSFTYDGQVINLLLSNVPLLVEVSINETWIGNPNFKVMKLKLPFTQLSCCLSQLEILMMNTKGAVYDQKHVFPVLANLKHLELLVRADEHVALRHLTSFMKASPFLQRLVLKMDFLVVSRKIGEIQKVGKCRHHYLKVVEIVGYRARTCFVENVMYLLKNVAALKKVVIDPVRRWEYLPAIYPTEMDRGMEEAKMEAEARHHAMQFLKPKVPSTIEFRIAHSRMANVVNFTLFMGNHGKLHTVFLREAYRKGELIEPNDFVFGRRKLAELVLISPRKAKVDSELVSYHRDWGDDGTGHMGSENAFEDFGGSNVGKERDAGNMNLGIGGNYD